MNRLFSVIALLIAILIALTAFASFQFVLKPLNVPESGYVFELKSGESLGHLALRLYDDEIIPSITVFKLYGRLTGSTSNLKAGEYSLREGDSISHLFNRLKQGSTVQRSTTFVEGWTYKELFSSLQQESYLTWDKDEQALKQSLTLMNDHFEGMFFADTYFYTKGQSAFELLKKSNQTLLKVLEQEWQNRAEDLPFDNAYEALILASIVEKETGLASERPLIAGVFINRLQKKMRLQTDPTVIYGLGENYNGNITKKDLQTYTPYNTYRIAGLPPTPIAIVGRESIHAVMHPQASDFLYFVAKGDGSHVFSVTLSEHEAAVKQYQWKRVKNYRSAPQKE